MAARPGRIRRALLAGTPPSARSRRKRRPMFAKARYWPILMTIHLVGGLALAQPPQGVESIPPPAPTPVPAGETPPPADAVAAVVNGQAILEMAVYRGSLRLRPDLREQARPEVLNYLIDNVIVDQYLVQLKMEISPKEIEEKVQLLVENTKKAGADFPTMLKKLHLSEEDLHHELIAALRWDKFVLQQATDKALHDLFDKNVEMFNGAHMQVRHILIKAAEDKKGDAAGHIAALRKEIETKVAQEVAKLPAGSDKITVEKERAKVLEKVFGETAERESACASRSQGGLLPYFPRVGQMVEPFARAAFALQTYQMSEPVATEFGVHLILVTDYRPGKDVKFDEVRPFVLEVYGEKLREAILASYKAKAKIELRSKKG
jgi:peptidyl-prolyl cis-trans isomerase C